MSPRLSAHGHMHYEKTTYLKAFLAICPLTGSLWELHLKLHVLLIFNDNEPPSVTAFILNVCQVFLALPMDHFSALQKESASITTCFLVDYSGLMQEKWFLKGGVTQMKGRWIKLISWFRICCTVNIKVVQLVPWKQDCDLTSSVACMFLAQPIKYFNGSSSESNYIL